MLLLLLLLLLLLRGRRELLLLRLRRRRLLVRERRPLMLPLLRLLTRRPRLLRLLLELRLLHGRRRLLLLRLRRQRPNGRLRRLLLLRLLRRPMHVLPLRLAVEARARDGFTNRFRGGSFAGREQRAVQGGCGNQRKIIATLQLLRLHNCCWLAVLRGRRGPGDLEHGKHSGRRRLATVGPGISQV